jgi:hypothetical protein
MSDHVFVVDDHQALADSLVDAIAWFGYRAKAVYSGSATCLRRGLRPIRVQATLVLTRVIAITRCGDFKRICKRTCRTASDDEEGRSPIN